MSNLIFPDDSIPVSQFDNEQFESAVTVCDLLTIEEIQQLNSFISNDVDNKISFKHEWIRGIFAVYAVKYSEYLDDRNKEDKIVPEPSGNKLKAQTLSKQALLEKINKMTSKQLFKTQAEGEMTKAESKLATYIIAKRDAMLRELSKKN